MSINVGSNDGGGATTLTGLTDVTVSNPSDLQVLTYEGSAFVNGYPELQMIQVRNDEGSTITAGTPLYSKGEIGGSNRILVGVADANDSAKMPCIGIAFEEMNTTSTKDNFGLVSGIYNTSLNGFTGLAVGDILYVSNTGNLTKDKPSATDDLIQNIGIVLRTNGTDCQGLLVSCIGRTNDIPNPPIKLEISGTDTDPILELENSNNAADKPALLRLSKSNHASDDMEIGKIVFQGEDDAGTPNQKEYASIIGYASDVTSAGNAQSGEMRFFALVNNTLTECIRIGREDTGAVPPISAFALQVNAGAADLDFIISGDNTPNLLRVNAADDLIGVGTSPNDSSAILQVSSTTQGFLPPRMTTTQQNAISSPTNGLVIYNTTTNKLMVYNGAWTALH